GEDRSSGRSSQSNPSQRHRLHGTKQRDQRKTCGARRGAEVNSKIRCCIYCRVSTTAGQSVEMQLRDLRQLAIQRGWEIGAEFCDEGVSGSSDSRPQLDKMLADAQRGKFQAILIWRLDRLGRSLQHLVRLFENFRAWNVALISFGEGLDFTTPMG